MKTTTTALLFAVAALATTGCNSINAELADLRERDSELADEIRIINDERKAVNQLMAALERLQREDSAAAEADVYEARKTLEEAEANR